MPIEKDKHMKLVEALRQEALSTFQDKILVVQLDRPGNLDSFHFSLPDEIDFDQDNRDALQECLYEYLIKIINKKKEIDV